MKNLLLSTKLAVPVLLSCILTDLAGQSVVFNEDFSGFTTCTHSSPSPSDCSGTLDTKTAIAGWTGYKVYSAGGEIKLGTSDLPGWIETPSINMSGFEDLLLKFDICSWSDENATVKISLNCIQLGNTITPGNDFQTIEIPLDEGITSGKIKFESLAKRFFLDNVQVVAQNATAAGNNHKFESRIKVYPNPAGEIVNIDNLQGFSRLEISDMNGRIMEVIDLTDSAMVQVFLHGLAPGIYIIKCFSGSSIVTSRLLKY